jgi:hypothetical protein
MATTQFTGLPVKSVSAHSAWSVNLGQFQYWQNINSCIALYNYSVHTLFAHLLSPSFSCQPVVPVRNWSYSSSPTGAEDSIPGPLFLGRRLSKHHTIVRASIDLQQRGDDIYSIRKSLTASSKLESLLPSSCAIPSTNFNPHHIAALHSILGEQNDRDNGTTQTASLYTGRSGQQANRGAGVR